MANCFYHDDKEAIARCAVCGKSICGECAKQSDGMTFCSDECKAKAATAAPRANDVLREKSASDSSAAVRKLIYIFVVITAIAAAWYFYGQHQKNIDRRASRSLKKIQKSSSDFLNAAGKAVPASSSYKRKAESQVKK